jgi:teichuronic acid biosynthesis glycosyltransferase TuaC
MVAQGADPEKISVIPNGVDTDTFRPLPRDAARRQLGLPADRPIVLSVGYRLERKGFHLLAEATAAIKKQHPDVLVVIVGGAARWGQDCTELIERQIQRSDVGENVRLVGPRPPRELPLWYSAADVFTLLTSREGCPNALLEALACGLPAVATSIGEIPRILDDPRLGIVLPVRSAESGASGVLDALGRTWDRHYIRHVMEGRSWDRVSEQIDAVFVRALANFHANREVSSTVSQHGPTCPAGGK